MDESEQQPANGTDFWKNVAKGLAAVLVVAAVAVLVVWFLTPWGKKRCVAPGAANNGLCPPPPASTDVPSSCPPTAPPPGCPSCPPPPPPTPDSPPTSLVSSPACSPGSVPPGCDPLVGGSSFSRQSQVFATDMYAGFSAPSGSNATLDPNGMVSWVLREQGSDNQIVGSSGTSVTGPANLTLQADGNLVSYGYTPDPTLYKPPVAWSWFGRPGAPTGPNWGTPPYSAAFDEKGFFRVSDSAGKSFVVNF